MADHHHLSDSMVMLLTPGLLHSGTIFHDPIHDVSGEN